MEKSTPQKASLESLPVQQAVVWSLDGGLDFPIWTHPKIEVIVKIWPSKDLRELKLDRGRIHLIYSHQGMEPTDAILSQDSLCLYLAKGTSERKPSRECLFLPGNTPVEFFQTIVDRALQAEAFRRAAIEIGTTCLENVGFFEGVFQLAKDEMETSHKENEALKSILSYQSKVKDTQNEIQTVLEKVTDLRNQEIIELHERVRATEKLEALRERELMEARELQKATEQILQFTKIEEMNMEKLIEAHNSLLEYTETQIRTLTKENQELKRKLEEKNQ